MGARTLVTFEQFEQYPDDGMKHELIQGEHTVVPPPKFSHGTVQHRLLRSLWRYADQCSLAGEIRMETGVKLSGDTWLQPDISYLRPEQLAAIQPNGYAKGAPAIAIEVLSESNTPNKVKRKTQQYLEHGAEEVWVVDPQKREVLIHLINGGSQTFASGELRSAWLPGWSIALDSLFEGA